MTPRRVLALVVCLAIPLLLFGRAGAAAAVPRPSGLYVLDDAANLNGTAQMYPPGLFSDTTYLHHVAGHAIFLPLAKMLPSVSTWGQFHYDWSVLDTLVALATSHGKAFSIELETGFQSSSLTYPQSLPAGFSSACGSDCAPLFDVWATGGTGGNCTSSYVLLPWVPRVQQFWSITADSLAAHLQNIGAYGSLTLVHVPGLSVYDEELRLPTGSPSPTSADTLPCPDGRPAYPTVMNDAVQVRWQALGYTDSAVIAGFKAIATSFANAFPDRVLGMSLFPHGTGAGVAFPNFTGDSAGYVAAQLVKQLAPIVPGRLEIQSDNLDSATIVTSVYSLAREKGAAIGWQTNKHGGTGAGCGGGGAGSCLPDAPDGHYFNLLAYGISEGGRYLEVWPRDVMTYHLGIAAADAAGFFTTAGVSPQGPDAPSEARLAQNHPNPFGRHTTIRFGLSRASEVRLAVYDFSGRRVRVLVDGRLGAGDHSVDCGGAGLPSGVYCYRLETDGRTLVRSLVVLR